MTEQIPNCFYRISIKALILDEEKRFLLVKEDNGLWELPGGGLDFGENPQDGIKRELQEEMGLNITFVAEKPSYFLTIPNLKNVYIANVLYETKVEDLNFTPSEECVEIKFFTKEEALQEKNLFPNVLEFAKIYKE